MLCDIHHKGAGTSKMKVQNKVEMSHIDFIDGVFGFSWGVAGSVLIKINQLCLPSFHEAGKTIAQI